MIKLCDLIAERIDFVNAGCESFAVALNKVFGYDFAMLYSKHDDWYLHVFCITKGKCIDANGVQTISQILQKFKVDKPHTIRLKDCILEKNQERIMHFISQGFVKSYFMRAAKVINANKSSFSA